MRVILASSSPRRKLLLKSLGFDLTIVAPHVDESILPHEAPREMVTRLSRKKAEAVGKNHDLPIIAADTIVVLNEEILGKPDDEKHARDMLMRLSGKSHEVLTGFTILKGEKHISNVVCTQVWFREINAKEIELYLQTREPIDKAGAYAIQEVGAALIDRIEGSYTNVIGLPLKEVLEALESISHVD